MGSSSPTFTLHHTNPDEQEMPPELVVEPGPPPPPAPPPRCSYGRAALTATGALICAVPYAIALALEEGLRALTGQGGTKSVNSC